MFTISPGITFPVSAALGFERVKLNILDEVNSAPSLSVTFNLISPKFNSPLKCLLSVKYAMVKPINVISINIVTIIKINTLLLIFLTFFTNNISLIIIPRFTY